MKSEFESKSTNNSTDLQLFHHSQQLAIYPVFNSERIYKLKLITKISIVSTSYSKERIMHRESLVSLIDSWNHRRMNIK